MTAMLRRSIVAILCVLFAGALGESRAEVRIKMAPNGQYMATEIFMSLTANGLLVWSPRKGGPPVRGDVLNPLGDVFGDRWPNIADNSVAPHHPWVVWSRLDGADYDLVWSEWEPGGWKTEEWLTEDPTDMGDDDLDADIAFDPYGDPYLIWWREEGGIGAILFSLKLDDGWTYPYKVSDDGIDCRFPRLVEFLPGGGGIVVEYDTPQGSTTQLIMVTRPTSITEDIDPLITVTTVPDEGGE